MTPHCTTTPAPPGYDLLLAVEDEEDPSGFFVFSTPVIAFEVQRRQTRRGGIERAVVAIGMDSETSETPNAAVRAPDGRVAVDLRETLDSVGDWLARLRHPVALPKVAARAAPAAGVG